MKFKLLPSIGFGQGDLYVTFTLFKTWCVSETLQNGHTISLKIMDVVGLEGL